MERAKKLFHQIELKRKNYFGNLVKETNLSMFELEILDFINRCPESNTFTEILNLKEYSKSHISTSITKLLNEGYIEKEQREGNKKVVYLKLLAKSERVIEKYNESAKNFRKVAFEDISNEEVDAFLNILTKISLNLERE